MTTRSLLAATAAAALALGACERPPVDNVQTGYRGVALEQNINPRLHAASAAENQAPETLPAAAPDTQIAGKVYQNLQVLGGLTVAEHGRTMIAFQQWVAPKTGPEAGCVYCHNPLNYASDEKYTKVVARRMLQMTQKINGEYTNHVAQTGVTCYTCHRGNPVPANIWFFTDRYQAMRYYLDRPDFRVQGLAALPADANNPRSIVQTQYAYTLMINMSTAVGVNCTYCHNSRIWSDWDQSSPKRIIALRGARMVRDLNVNYLVPLQGVWPANRLGPQGDGPKLYCATCHNGVFKPLYGAKMAAGYPALHPGTGLAVPAPAGDSAAAAAGAAPMTPAPAATTPAAPAPAAQPAAPATGTGPGAMGGQGPSGKKPPLRR